MKLWIIGIAMLCTLQSMAQSKQDYTWLWGWIPIEDGPNKRGVEYKFTAEGIQIKDQWLAGAVFRQVGLMSDKETGELLFYTNGCSVYNWNHRKMDNGDEINDVTPQFDLYCPGGYASVNTTMILPDPSYEDGYYIIHKPSTLIFEDGLYSLETQSILYTYVDMSLNDGKGAVTMKNQILYDEEVTNYGFLNACQHANGKDWWILQPLKNSNTFLSILLTEEGFEVVGEQSIGSYLDNEDGVGQTTYVRDGSQYVINSYLSQLLLYDFDRSTGLLSNDRKVIIEESPDIYESNRGVAFSANNRLLYVSTTTELYQIDLWEEDLQEHLVLIDTFALRADGYDSYFNYILTGPDCKLYITASAGTQFMHVIHHPDEKGAACDFQQDGIEAPHFLPSAFSYINPHWRIDEAEPCDATMTGLYDIHGVAQKSYTIYPNPSSSKISIDLESASNITEYEVYTIDGKMLRAAKIVELKSDIDISSLTNGMYFLKLYDKEGRWQYEKFVKE